MFSRDSRPRAWRRAFARLLVCPGRQPSPKNSLRGSEPQRHTDLGYLDSLNLAHPGILLPSSVTGVWDGHLKSWILCTTLSMAHRHGKPHRSIEPHYLPRPCNTYGPKKWKGTGRSESTHTKTGELSMLTAFRSSGRNNPIFRTYMDHFINISHLSLFSKGVITIKCVRGDRKIGWVLQQTLPPKVAVEETKAGHWGR